MRLMASRFPLVVMNIIIMVLISGCASFGAQKVNLLYRPVTHVSGGAGDLYLVTETVPASGQRVLGTISDGNGVRTGNIVTDIAPADLLADALIREFRQVGFNVILVTSPPVGVDKGLILKKVTIDLNEEKGLFSAESTCRVDISVEPWRHGRALGRLQYTVDVTDTAVTARDELPSKTLRHGLRTLMSRSVPEITRKFEQDDHD